MNYKHIISAALALSVTCASFAVAAPSAIMQPDGIISNQLIAQAADTVNITESGAGFECAYAKWNEVSGASGYAVYYKSASGSSVKLDNELIRKYPDYFRADAVGLPAGSYTLTVVPIISGSEDSSKAASANVSVTANDRTGFGWVNGTSSGAYNEDGSLKSNAVVLYITEDTKNTVSMDVVMDSKGTATKCTGIQGILDGYKKGYETRPLAIRFVGKVTDPAVLTSGDLLIKGNGDTKRLSCGITVEGIGDDATLYGFGVRLANCSNVEVRNIGVMLVDSSEGDNITLQQSCDHIWVHNCDSFYGMAGGDADQAKGDGALDCKKSTYITFSYNHFWDNGKCNLLGLSEGTVDDLYITYHHNWYDHSDSRHPRVRFYSAHVYNNYYDGNAKYGIGSTNASSIFSESNYFRNCKYPMLISMQGSDIASGEGGTFSSEDGGIIKAYGNIIEGAKAFVPYSENNTEFDAYVVANKTDKVPSSVLPKQTSKLTSLDHAYNNFDTSSIMYKYTADDAKDVPAIVQAKAGRLNGGDFKFEFNDSVDDELYSVNQELMAALKAYTPKGSSAPSEPIVTTPSETTTVTTTTTAPVQTTSSQQTTAPQTPSIALDAIYCSPNGTGNGSSMSSPTDVLTAVSSVKAGGTIYLLEGTYKFSEMILIDQNNSGTASAYKTIMAYPGAKVVWDFSGQGDADGSKRGVTLDGNYWRFYGFEITKAADNGMLLSGNNNIIEMMVFNDNQDTGLQVSRYRTDAATVAEWPSNNLIKNCTSKNNCDNATMENADGFAAKLTCGEGNVFDGCIAYNNSDDGWDLFAKDATGPIGVVTLRNCIAFRNGFTEFGEGYGDCDGNGFKLGGSGVGSAHIVENCLAFENLNCGFTDNNNPLLESLTNCTAFNNNVGGNGKPNFSLYRCTDDGCDFKNILSYSNDTANKVPNDKFVGTMENSVYYNSKYRMVSEKVAVENGYKGGEEITISDSDFMSVTVAAMGADFHTAWRNADGSPNPAGFAETPSNGTYASLGYHMANGVSQVETPSTPDTPPTTPTETTVTTTTTSQPVETSSETTTVTTPSETTTVTTPSETTVTSPSETTTAGGGDASVTKLGDATNDGGIDVRDVTAMCQHIVKLETLTGQGAINADINKDGTVDVKDLSQLKKYLINAISSLD
ncbi:MAG: dockerin type I domain-containing protein [Oscillospiraceae bacterium]